MRLCFILLLSFLSLSSFSQTDSHLMVGGWQIKSSTECSILSNKSQIYQWNFWSDEFTMTMFPEEKRKKKQQAFAYRFIEDHKDFDSPVLLLKDPNIDNLLLVFTIKELSKSELVLTFEKDKSSKNVHFSQSKLVFERISGPEENMPEHEE